MWYVLLKVGLWTEIFILENRTGIEHIVEVDIIEERTTIIEELMSPTFIVLAASVGAATVIVILLIGLICHKICRSKPGYIVEKIQEYSEFINTVKTYENLKF